MFWKSHVPLPYHPGLGQPAGADCGNTGRGKSRNEQEKNRRTRYFSSSNFFQPVSTFSSSGVPTICPWVRSSRMFIFTTRPSPLPPFTPAKSYLRSSLLTIFKISGYRNVNPGRVNRTQSN